MKRKILSLVFAAAMLLGTATMTSGDNNWGCDNVFLSCGPLEIGHMVLICGDNEEQFYSQWVEWQQLLCETLDDDGFH